MSPTETTLLPATSVLAWAGSARSTTVTAQPGVEFTVSFEGAVTWQREESPDPALPLRPGAVRYGISSGRLHVVFAGTHTFVYPDETYTCTDQGAEDIELAPDTGDPVLRSFLDLGEDDQYVGSVYQKATVTVFRTCPQGPVGSHPFEMRMRLKVEGGVIDGRHMQGEMPPEVLGGETTTGSWDFTAR